jgi:hypothetical protein
MKSSNETTPSNNLEKKTILQDAKVLRTTDEDIFVCEQGDKACWHRYSSAMGDCV